MANDLSTNMDKLQKRIIKVIAIAYKNLSSKEACLISGKRLTGRGIIFKQYMSMSDIRYSGMGFTDSAARVEMMRLRFIQIKIKITF